VLSGDPLTMELPALRDLHVELTMVGGQAVHCDSEVVPAFLRP
jgi:hypothetical protein